MQIGQHNVETYGRGALKNAIIKKDNKHKTLVDEFVSKSGNQFL